MNACGIVVEYNPFHNGHKYHIEKARELTNCDVLIAVMSGNFVQRGDFAICNKTLRAKEAIKNGVDIVIELPYIYATQSATKFAYGAVQLLNIAQVDSICFGSETNNLEELKEIADTSINPDHLKELLRTGESYPKAYGLLAPAMGPNDILAVSYLKALKDTNIKPYSILRTTQYHDETLSELTSAKAIRKALLNKEDISLSTPMADTLVNEPIITLEMMYPTIRQLLLTLPKDEIASIFMMSEGIENHLIKCARDDFDFKTFMNHAVSKRYTTSRIQRCLLHLLNHITKQEVNALPPLDTIRILAFNEKGQEYLKQLKKKEVKIANNFSQYPSCYAQMELKTTYTYCNLLKMNKAKEIIHNEITGSKRII